MFAIRNWLRLLPLMIIAGLPVAPADSAELVETPSLRADVDAGRLPAIEQRLPSTPSVVRLAPSGKTAGRHGGSLTTLIRKAKDVKMMSVYGYARLVGYASDLQVVPDILLALRVKDGRIFTLELRPGHKWSDGHPFTAEDFRYWWEDVANNKVLSPAGPPKAMLVDGRPPKFEILDARTIRFAWHRPNPQFVPRLAATAPLFPYRPAHYLKRYHAKYAEPGRLAKATAAARQQNWAGLHDQLDNLYLSNNPDQPTLQPWVNSTRMPAILFVGVRNPYYHRIDEKGRQLPYIDRLLLQVVEPRLIAAKTATGESDLQIRGLVLNDVAFLKQHEASSRYRTLLWRLASGSQFALFPNMNARDGTWRTLLRDVRFRRALSLGIDRSAVNQIVFFGQASEGNNTVLPDSPLYRRDYRTKWAEFDPARANALLDEIGLKREHRDGMRVLADGRKLEIIAETAGEASEQTDILELIASTWKPLGIKLLIRPLQREVLRKRILSGQTHLSVWTGLINGVPTPEMSPSELAPTTRLGFQWPKWGYNYETGGAGGEPPDTPIGQQLLQLYEQWLSTTDREGQEEIWHEMLSLHAAQVLSIGVVAGAPQPVVVRNTLMNVPETGFYNWEPGALIGMYRPDTFWFK